MILQCPAQRARNPESPHRPELVTSCTSPKGYAVTESADHKFQQVSDLAVARSAPRIAPQKRATPRFTVRIILLNWVELRRFELLTSCMPSSGNPSTRVCSRRSPSRRVHPVPASGPVAVLPCCTIRSLPPTQGPALSQPPRATHLPARRRDPRSLSRSPPQTARDRHPAKVSRRLHHRHRMDARRWLSPRNARRRLRRLGDRDRK